MKKLIEDLKEKNMTTNNCYASFSISKVPAGGLLGALIDGGSLWYCSVTMDYFYYFKIKNVFSYKGIKEESINRISLRNISKIILKTKSYGYGSFSIEHSNGFLSGIFDNKYTGRENFEQILTLLKNEYKINCFIE